MRNRWGSDRDWRFWFIHGWNRDDKLHIRRDHQWSYRHDGIARLDLEHG
jgi:hypothetical protein